MKKIEKILQEIPCLYEDYKNGVIKKYTPFGSFYLTEKEKEAAKNITHKSKVLCVIQQEMSISGENVSLTNYVIEERGFQYRKHDYIDWNVLEMTQDRNVDISKYQQTSYVFNAYCYNQTWNQYDHGEIGILPYNNTIIRVW